MPPCNYYTLCIFHAFSYDKEWKRIRSAISKQVIPKRVSNLTAPICDITDDLLNYLNKTNNGKIDDITPIITKWTFQSESKIDRVYIHAAII